MTATEMGAQRARRRVRLLMKWSKKKGLGPLSARRLQIFCQALVRVDILLIYMYEVIIREGIKQKTGTKSVVFNLTPMAGTGPLDVRIKRLAGQRDDLQDTVRRLKLDLEEERSRSSLARGAASQEELERCHRYIPLLMLSQ